MPLPVSERLFALTYKIIVTAAFESMELKKKKEKRMIANFLMLNIKVKVLLLK